MRMKFGKVLFVICLVVALVCVFAACAGSSGSKSSSSSSSSNNNTPTDPINTESYEVTILNEDGDPVDLVIFYVSTGNRIRVPAKQNGRTFLGFYRSDGICYFDENGYQEENLMITTDLLLYQRWENANCKVLLDVGTGEFRYGESGEFSVVYGVDVQRLPVPEKNGYDFLGWKNKSGTFVTDGSGHPTAAAGKMGAAYQLDEKNEATLTAAYDIKKITVTLDYNDAAIAPVERKLNYGDSLTDLPTPDYGGGYKCFGWSTNPYARSNEAFTSFGPVTEDVTLYAVCSQYKYLNLVYTESNVKEVLFCQDVGAFVFPIGEEPVEENPGYNCTGWYRDSSLAGSAKVSRVYFNDSVDTFYATWEKATYRLTLKDENGASFEGGSWDADFTIDSDAIALPSFEERDEYEFMGWATADEKRVFKTEIPGGTYGSLVLQPLWKAYTSTFVLLIDGEELSREDIRYNRVFSLPVPTLTDGKVFAYWYYYEADVAVPLTNERGASYENWMQKGGEVNVFCKYLVTNEVTVSYEDPLTGESVSETITATEGRRVSITKPAALKDYEIRGYYVNKVLQSEDEVYIFLMPDHAVTVEIRYSFPTANFTLNGADVYTFNGHLYAVVNTAMTWTSAESFCEFYGGHLITITSAEEQAYSELLMKKYVTDGRSCWIGATDAEKEGTWKWVTGETFAFQKWASGEPNNSGGSENYAICYAAAQSNRWNDASGSSSLPFICEWDAESKANIEVKKLTDNENKEIKLEVLKYNGHYYAAVTTEMNWVPAERYAENLGGHLVTISDEAENAFVNKLRKNAGLGNAFIGWTDYFEEGKWEWVTGEVANYTKWTSGNPDNYQDEDFGQFYTDGGEWNDVHGTGDYKHAFVIEWEKAQDIGVNKPLYVDGVIRSASDLKKLTRSFPVSVFTLENDVNMAGLEWTPCDFAGTLDGKNHKILNYGYETAEVNCGFIKTLTGTIKNLSFKDLSLTSTVSDKSSSCSLVNTLQGGTLENVEILSGTVRAGVAETGAICSFVSGASTIRNCVNRATVVSENANTSYENSGTTGGIIAWISGGTPTVEGCENYGDITGTYEVGGILGGANVTFTIKNCLNYGAINGKYYVGGLIGCPRKSLTIDGGYADMINVTALGNSGKYAGGPGAATYQNFETKTISTAAEMSALISAVSAESFVLARDIDLTDENWAPAAFAGSLDGKGHKIKGLTDSLFATLNGTVKDLVVETTITKDCEGSAYVGGVAAIAGTGAVLSGVEVQGEVTPVNAQNTGGLVGVINASQTVKIENCVNGATVTMNREDMSIGGIVGYIYQSATITFENNVNNGAVSNACYNAAGMIGASKSAITFKNCVNNGDIAGANCIGGIVGYMNGVTATIDNCKNYGAISGTNWQKYVGGGSASYVNFETVGIGSAREIGCLVKAVSAEKFELTADIDMTDVSWTPCALACSLDGKGFSIKNLTLASESGDLAMFTSLTGTVKDLVLDNVSVTSASYTKVNIAALANASSGSVSGVTVRGAITGDLCNASGLVSNATGGRIENCLNYATINGTTSSTDGSAAGLIYSINGATVDNCVNYGAVNGKRLTGGVIAYIGSGTLSNAKNCGAVTGGDYAGGVIAQFGAGNVPNLSNEGAVTGGAYTGGVIGYISCGGDLTFTSEYVNKGAVTGKDNTGGVIGYLKDYRSMGYNDCNNTVKIDKWTNQGNIVGANYVGGVIGQISVWADHSGSHTSVIKIVGTNLKNEGNVTATSHAGGLIGYGSSNSGSSKISASSSKGTITASYVVGGLFGQLSTVQVDDCSNEGTTVVATGYQIDGSIYHAYLGGYLGIGYTVSNCANTADIVYTDRGDRVGGIVGSIGTGSISSCSNTGNIAATKANYVGGIAGFVDCGGSYTLNALTNAGDISGAAYVGGIFGYVKDYRSMGYNDCYHTFSLNRSSNTGDISAAGSFAGGIVGYATCSASHDGSHTSVIALTATTLTNEGDVTAGDAYAGGLFGYASSNYTVSLVKDSSSKGAITARYMVGGLAGQLSTIKLTDCSNAGVTVTATEYQIDNTNYNAYLGGYCGYSYSVENCENRADIVYTDRGRFVGGISGYTTGGMALLKNYGAITADKATQVGGIFGYGGYAGDVSFVDLENHGAVTGKDRVGGVGGEIYDYRSMGYNDCNNTVTMTRLSNDAAVGGGSYIGGIVGYASVSARHDGSHTSVIKIMMQNPANAGAVTGSGDYIGGIFGSASSNNDASRIIAPTTTGEVSCTGSGTHVGARAGQLSNISVEE